MKLVNPVTCPIFRVVITTFFFVTFPGFGAVVFLANYWLYSVCRSLFPWNYHFAVQHNVPYGTV